MIVIYRTAITRTYESLTQNLHMIVISLILPRTQCVDGRLHGGRSADPERTEGRVGSCGALLGATHGGATRPDSYC